MEKDSHDYCIIHILRLISWSLNMAVPCLFVPTLLVSYCAWNLQPSTARVSASTTRRRFSRKTTWTSWDNPSTLPAGTTLRYTISSCISCQILSCHPVRTRKGAIGWTDLSAVYRSRLTPFLGLDSLRETQERPSPAELLNQPSLPCSFVADSRSFLFLCHVSCCCVSRTPCLYPFNRP